MLNDKVLDYVAHALGCNASELDMGTRIYGHPLWDSLGQLKIMLALEQDKGIPINDETVDLYVSVRAISALFEEQPNP